jgi:RNase P/RNase MRP subunit p29
MTVTPSIVQYEFIGIFTKIVKSSNTHVVGIAGKIVDETRNTFTISCNDSEKKVVIKDTAVF